MQVSTVAELRTRLRDGAVPFEAVLELTERCNLTCRHCFRRPPTPADARSAERRVPGMAEPRELSTPELVRLLDELASAGCLKLTLTGGEPLLRAELFEVLQHARATGFRTTLFTNGTLIDEATARRLAESGVARVEVSLYGASGVTHDWVAGVTGAFERGVAGLRWLLQAGLRPHVKMTLGDLSRGCGHDGPGPGFAGGAVELELEKARDLATGLGCSFTANVLIYPSIHRCRDGGVGRVPYGRATAGLPAEVDPRDLRLPPEVVARLHRAGLLDWGLGPDDDPAPASGGMCGAGSSSCCVSPEGDVFPCVTLRLPAGNVRAGGGFTRVWRESDTLLTLRRLDRLAFKQCPACGHVGACPRCPGMSWLEHGDMLAPSSVVCSTSRAVWGEPS